MSRSRASMYRRAIAMAEQTVASIAGSSTPAGALAAAAWLRSCGTTPPSTTRWHVQITLDVVDRRPPTEFDDRIASRFHLDIYSEEWGVYFCHAARSSWIRVTDIAFVHGRDDHQLLARMPPLQDIGTLLRELEQQHGIRFQRQHASIVTNLPNSEPAIRSWVAML